MNSQEQQELLDEVRSLHAERALAPGMECKCKWCDPEAHAATDDEFEDDDEPVNEKN